jgi:cellulose synthase operon protein C
VTWLLLHPAGVALVPPALFTRLLGSEDADRRACGARILAALSDDALRQQLELLCTLATSGHAGVRAAIAPALLRVAQGDGPIARSVASRLHDSLFQSEAGEGQHDDALRWLTVDLQAFAPARDPSGTWRALQARSGGAQRYGAWALASLQASDFTLRQLATLARHADAGVREWAMRAIDQTLPAVPSPQQAADLLPLADAAFDDARAYTQRLFGERLPDESLDVELLVAWVDHPQAWMQALGRSRLVRRMSAADASLCLTRLSQHPSTQVQLFVTQWLLELPADDPPRLAQQLRALTPYFLTVLSQVHRGRVAKSRITDFLRAQIAAPETAAVVAEIFARQVVTASLTDKPQYIAGLRDIAARHPQIELPFLAWKTPAVLEG